MVPLNTVLLVLHTVRMWNKILAVNTFVIWPLTGILFVYALGNIFFTGNWKLVVISGALFVGAVIAQFVLGVLDS